MGPGAGRNNDPFIISPPVPSHKQNVSNYFRILVSRMALKRTVWQHSARHRKRIVQGMHRGSSSTSRGSSGRRVTSGKRGSSMGSLREQGLVLALLRGVKGGQPQVASLGFRRCRVCSGYGARLAQRELWPKIFWSQILKTLFRVFRPHILCFLATYSVLFGQLFFCLLPVAWKRTFSRQFLRFLGFKVFTSCVWCTELLFTLCTEVKYQLGEVRLVQHMVFICCVCSRSVG